MFVRRWFTQAEAREMNNLLVEAVVITALDIPEEEKARIWHDWRVRVDTYRNGPVSKTAKPSAPAQDR